MHKRVLIVTPRSPFSGRGADEQDRLGSIEWFIAHGFEVQVVTKTMPSDEAIINDALNKYPIKIFPIRYKEVGKKSLRTIVKRLSHPLYWDGAAYEYFDPEIQSKVKEIVTAWKPDLVWFDYTYLWPLYGIVHSAGIPIVTRSINYEPEHFLDEDGRTIINRIRALPKYRSERRAFRGSDWFFAITPKEEAVYKQLGTTPVRTLPLRALPSRLAERRNAPHEGVRIGFMPSTYTVDHNKEALRFLIEDVWPMLPDDIRARSTLHVTGNKFPDEFRSKLPKEVVYEGFVPSSIEFWQGVDIALSPSLFGAGMQQKIFEPLALGVPTITSKRGLAGYPFVCGMHLVCAETKEEVCAAITNLIQDSQLRQFLSRAAQMLSRELFAQEKFDTLMDEMLTHI